MLNLGKTPLDLKHAMQQALGELRNLSQSSISKEKIHANLNKFNDAQMLHYNLYGYFVSITHPSLDSYVRFTISKAI